MVALEIYEGRDVVSTYKPKLTACVLGHATDDVVGRTCVEYGSEPAHVHDNVEILGSRV